MAASMNAFPGGAEDDDFDDDGFILGGDEYFSDEKIDFQQFQEKRDTPSVLPVIANDSSGFGRPPSKNDAIYQPPPRLNEIRQRPRDQGTLGMDDFRMAAIKGSLPVLRSFLEKGFDVNATLKCGWTALLYAANSANSEVVHFLVDHGADINSHKDMYTVLMAACGSSSNNKHDVDKIISLLLDKGADVNSHDRYHLSPLMYAAREGKDEVCVRLLDHGASINKQDSRGWTALSWAVSRNKKKTVKLLLDRKADSKKRHCDNSTASDLAREQENDELIALFEDDDKGQRVPNLTKDIPVIPSCKFTNGAKSDQAYNNESPDIIVKYGELELFLAGLDLNSYIQLFQSQQVDFSSFLCLTDEDLIKMGVEQIGVRKKILDGIHAVHKKEWEKSSINTVPNRRLSCADYVAMVANICKHVKYVSSTISYIRTQIAAHPHILRAQDGTSPKQIHQHSQDALHNVGELETELQKLNTHLHKVLQKEDFDPPDMIKSPKVRKAKLNIKGILKVGVCVGTVGIVIWKRHNVLQFCHSLLADT